MTRHIGFVLKKLFPQQLAISLFDQHCGKIIAQVKDDSVCLGALIQFDCTQKTARYRAANHEALIIPFDIASDNILFFHHVLELCDTFLPLSVVETHTFELLQWLYTHGMQLRSPALKKFFLLKLCLSLGLYPENNLIDRAPFRMLQSFSIDSFCHQDIDLESETRLNTWLLACLGTHLQQKSLRTIHFYQGI